ncbi:MAG: hypothetical protein KY467_02805 [Gemmatimonadetes bacterium]|nr:hypothetical protein [Gemmatimonadota bacterium]
MPSGIPAPAFAHHPAVHPAAEEVLRGDPAGAYASCDTRTQWQYHVALAEWERRTGVDRVSLARSALARAEAGKEADGADAPTAHVGYYLVGDGVREFGMGSTTGSAGARKGPRLAPELLVPLVVTLATLLPAACIAVLHGSGSPAWVQVLAATAAVPLGWVYASTISRTLPWHRRVHLPLPRLRAGEGRASDEAVVIVVPAITTSPARAHALVQRLWALYEAQPAAEFRFALLSDFGDAPAQASSDDEAILAELQAGIAALNARARDSLGDRFFALHRRRTWSATQEAWIGWERKRGKLLEFVRLLRPGSPETTFRWQFGDLPGLVSRASIPFVITLDETTWLAPGAAAELIRTAAHPLNRPHVDETTGRVTSGYAVLQPSVLFTLDPPPTPTSDASPPSRGAARAGGPTFYFSTLGVGMHQGAGALYHVDAFRRALDGAFPDDLVLHHDLLDGFVGRTGEAYEAAVHQPLPKTYLAQAQRGHRWLRGVFQAIPFLLRASGARRGTRGRNPLTGVQRFIVAELVLLELAPAASLTLLLLAWTVLPGAPTFWTLLACPPLFVLGAFLLRRAVSLPIRRLRGGRRSGWGPALHRMASAGFAQVVLVYQAFVVVDALARVAWRLGVSRKRLLEWAPRHDSASTSATPLAAYWRALWVSPAVGALTLAALAAWRPGVLWIAAPFAVAWIAAPVIVGLGDRYVFGVEGPT